MHPNDLAREQAKTLKCQTQLRQVGQALYNYACVNQGQLPAWSGWQVAGGNGAGEDTPGDGWTEQLQRYAAGPLSAMYNCPSFPEEYRINYFMSARWTNLSGRHNLRFGQMKLSSMFVLGGDCTQKSLYPATFGNTGYTTDDCDKDDATQEGVVFADESGGLNVHRTGNNVLFGDGHVELKRKWDATAMTYNPKRMEAWAAVTPN